MKRLILIACSLISLSTHAFTYKPAVLKAVVDAKKQTITVTVKHGGGCGDHNYSLKMNSACLESYPVQCMAEIFNTTEDICEAIIVRDAIFTFEELNLNDEYFNGATLTISGGQDYINGRMVDTQATVTLPLKIVPPTFSGIDTDTDSGIDTDTDSGIDTDTDSGIDTDTDSEIDTDTDSGIDTDTDSEIDTDTE